MGKCCRIKTVRAHILSADHTLSLAAYDTQQAAINKEAVRLQEKKMRAVRLGPQCSFWCAVQEVPNAKYKELLAFLRFLEVPEALHLCKSGNVRYDLGICETGVNIILSYI